MEESSFYDIRVPTTLDMSEINSNTLFPSLMDRSISLQEGLPKVTEKRASEYVKSSDKSDKQSNKKVIINQDDFP